MSNSAVAASNTSKWYSLPRVVERYDNERFGRRGGKITDIIERRTVTNLLGNLRGKRVLDIATGKGRLALELVKHGAKVTGVDASQPMLEKARDKIEELPAAKRERIDFRQGDCRQLDFPSNHFDYVSSLRFIHLTKNPSPYLQEMVRVAKEKVVFDFFSLHSLRLAYNPLLQMGSHLHRASKMLSLLDQLDVRRVRIARRFTVPFGALRLAEGGLANILERIDRGITSNYGKFCSVVYFSAELD